MATIFKFISSHMPDKDLLRFLTADAFSLFIHPDHNYSHQNLGMKIFHHNLFRNFEEVYGYHLTN